MKKLVFIYFILALLNVYASIGKITFVNGTANILREEKNFIAKLGDDILSKDIINTEENSKLQIIFNDKTVITIGNKSKFSINDYYYNENNSKESKLDMNFSNGFFKTITGKIGKINPSKFKLNTKSASIGIRGTQISMTTDAVAGDFIACTSGEISVTSNLTGTSVIVPSGNFTKIVPGINPTPPEAYSSEQLNNLATTPTTATEEKEEVTVSEAENKTSSDSSQTNVVNATKVSSQETQTQVQSDAAAVLAAQQAAAAAALAAQEAQAQADAAAALAAQQAAAAAALAAQEAQAQADAAAVLAAQQAAAAAALAAQEAQTQADAAAALVVQADAAAAAEIAVQEAQSAALIAEQAETAAINAVEIASQEAQAQADAATALAAQQAAAAIAVQEAQTQGDAAATLAAQEAAAAATLAAQEAQAAAAAAAAAALAAQEAQAQAEAEAEVAAQAIIDNQTLLDNIRLAFEAILSTKQVQYDNSILKMGYWKNPFTGKEVSTYVEGTTTPSSKLKDYKKYDISAQYNGVISAIHTKTNGSKNAVGGSATFDVDFGNKKIDGTFIIGDTDWKTKITDISIDKYSSFSTTNIENNGSSTTGTTGTIAGKFYGPNADNIGGNIDMNSSNNGSVKGSFATGKIGSSQN